MEKLKCNSGNFYVVAVAVVEDKDGEVKKVRKTIVVEATSFGDAELKALDSMGDYSVGDVEVLNITPAAFSEVYSSCDSDDDKFYKGRLHHCEREYGQTKENQAVDAHPGQLPQQGHPLS